jgi:hypothetical protein
LLGGCDAKIAGTVCFIRENMIHFFWFFFFVMYLKATNVRLPDRRITR